MHTKVMVPPIPDSVPQEFICDKMPHFAAFQQMQYDKFVQSRPMFPPEKISLPPCTSLTGTLQQRAMMRAASLYAYHDLGGASMPTYFQQF